MPARNSDTPTAQEICKVGLLEWKKGTGSEPDKLSNRPEIHPARCPFSPVTQWRRPKKGTGTVGITKHHGDN